MRTVIVHGVCTQNVGDDLFFYILKERYPNTRFVMYAPDEYKNTLGRDKKWIIISRSDFPTRLSFFVGKILRLPLLTFLYFWLIIRYRANLFLFIGGSLFMEGKSNMPTFISGLNKLRRIRPKMKITYAKTGQYLGLIVDSWDCCNHKLEIYDNEQEYFSVSVAVCAAMYVSAVESSALRFE